MERIDAKTATLLAACCDIGSVLAGCRRAARRAACVRPLASASHSRSPMTVLGLLGSVGRDRPSPSARTSQRIRHAAADARERRSRHSEQARPSRSQRRKLSAQEAKEVVSSCQEVTLHSKRSIARREYASRRAHAARCERPRRARDALAALTDYVLSGKYNVSVSRVGMTHEPVKLVGVGPGHPGLATLQAVEADQRRRRDPPERWLWVWDCCTRGRRKQTSGRSSAEELVRLAKSGKRITVLFPATRTRSPRQRDRREARPRGGRLRAVPGLIVELAAPVMSGSRSPSKGVCLDRPGLVKERKRGAPQACFRLVGIRHLQAARRWAEGRCAGSPDPQSRTARTAPGQRAARRAGAQGRHVRASG